MPTYAIIETGGKQYRVEPGQFLLVDRLPDDEGAKVALRPVMLRTDDDVVLDAPGLEKVKVEATVASHELGEKIQVFKYKAKKGYRKRQGYRSSLTRIEVTEVKQLTRKPAAKKDEAPKEEEAATEEKPAAKKAPAKEKPKAEAQEPAVSGAGELPEGLDKPVTEALEGAGLTTLAKVAEKTEDEILELKGIGPKAAETLAEALAAEGLSFKQTDTTGEEE
jgi:large subunit ribosomal protein L21